MIKKILILLTIFMTLNVFANDRTFFDSNSNNQTENEIGVVDDPDQPAPIDDYAFLLGIGGIGLAVFFYRRKLIFK